MVRPGFLARSHAKFQDGRHAGGPDLDPDIDGTRVVLRTTWDPEASQVERDELQAIVDSVRIARPGETPPPQPAAP